VQALEHALDIARLEAGSAREACTKQAKQDALVGDGVCMYACVCLCMRSECVSESVRVCVCD